MVFLHISVYNLNIYYLTLYIGSNIHYIFPQVRASDDDVSYIAVSTSFASMATNPSVNYEHWKDLGFAYKNKGKFLRKGNYVNKLTFQRYRFFKVWLTTYIVILFFSLPRYSSEEILSYVKYSMQCCQFYQSLPCPSSLHCSSTYLLFILLIYIEISVLTVINFPGGGHWMGYL